MNLKEYTRIYYTGDMANDEGTGTITRRYQDKWGDHLDIQMDDGREIKSLSVVSFSEEYLGHGGTRFVTLQAYNNFRRAQFKKMGIEYIDAQTVNVNV